MLHIEIHGHSDTSDRKTITLSDRPSKAAAPRARPSKQEPVIADVWPSAITRRRSDAPSFATPMPSLPPPTDEEHEPPPPFEPLFQPIWTRALLGPALPTPHPNGPVDLPALGDDFSRASG